MAILESLQPVFHNKEFPEQMEIILRLRENRLKVKEKAPRKSSGIRKRKTKQERVLEAAKKMSKDDLLKLVEEFEDGSA